MAAETSAAKSSNRTPTSAYDPARELIDGLSAHGELHGDWRLCFDQLAEGIYDTLYRVHAENEAERLQLTAQVAGEQDATAVHLREKLRAQQRVRELEGICQAQTLQIAQLQTAGGVVLAEIHRLRKKYGESDQASPSQGPREATPASSERDAQSLGVFEG